MTLDVAHAPVFIADIMDDLSKSTEVAPGCWGLFRCHRMFTSAATVRVDLMRTSHIMAPPFPIRSPTSLDTEKMEALTSHGNPYSSVVTKMSRILRAALQEICKELDCSANAIGVMSAEFAHNQIDYLLIELM